MNIDEGEGRARNFLWCAFLFFHRLYIQGDCMYATCIDTCSTLISDVLFNTFCSEVARVSRVQGPVQQTS